MNTIPPAERTIRPAHRGPSESVAARSIGRALVVTIAAGVVAGCAWLAPLKYDPVLANYLVAAEVQARAVERACGDESAWYRARTSLVHVVELGTAYAEYTADPAAVELARGAAEVVKRDGGIGLMGTVACRESARNVQLSYRRILVVMHGRER